jgi:hypothetical protein
MERWTLSPGAGDALTEVEAMGDCFGDRVCVIDRDGARLNAWSATESQATWLAEINLAALLGASSLEVKAIGMLDDAARTSATTFIVTGVNGDDPGRLYRIDGIAPQRVTRPGSTTTPGSRSTQGSSMSQTERAPEGSSELPPNPFH